MSCSLPCLKTLRKCFPSLLHSPTIPSTRSINCMNTQTDMQGIQNFYTNDVVPHLDKSPTFLGNCEFPKDFNITTRSDNQLDNQTFSDPNTKRERKFLLFGEIASAERSTKLGAQGNHYSASMNEVRLLSSYSSSNTAHNTHLAHPYQRWVSCKRHLKTSRTDTCYKGHRNPVCKSSRSPEGSCHREHRKGQEN